MTDWKEVYGSMTEKPAEFDATSSSVIVYQHRNAERVKVGEDELWKYEERELTHDEYYVIRTEAQQAVIDKNTANIDYVAMMADVDLPTAVEEG